MKSKEPGARGDEYRALKGRVTDAMFALFESHFPDLAKLVVFRNLSTPLTKNTITGHHKGAFYGLDTTPDRLMSDALQARTPIPGLYHAGQDVMTPGMPVALLGWFACRRNGQSKAVSANARLVCK